MRILLVEDDLNLGKILKIALEKEGFIIDFTDNAEDAIDKVLQLDYSLILLDLTLPEASGIEFCERLQTTDKNIPIIVITATSEVDTKLQAFQLGIDDYVVKPFNRSELIARIHAVLRRENKNLKDSILEVADLCVDLERREVTRAGKKIHLRPKEFKLLVYLMQHKGKVVKRKHIIDHVWQEPEDQIESTVTVHMSYLRNKIDKGFSQQLIHRIYGTGYKISEEE